MAERRMFAKTIVLSDAFLDMPMSARCLYFTLGMLADDDGFINSPKSIMRQCGASNDDMSLLIAKKFIIPFEDGVVVIKHWRINNYLRNDRYIETKYTDDKAQLETDKNGAYTMSGIPGGIPTVYPGKDRLGKDSIGKDNKYIVGQKTPDGADEVIDYLNERTGRSYKHVESNRRFIRARLAEGYTVQDCKDVIDKKCVEWMGKDMEKYLRPETLFNATKFQNYVNSEVHQEEESLFSIKQGEELF